MSEKKSVKELQEMLDLALMGVEVGVKASADGKVDLSDLALLIPLVGAVSPAIDGVGEIPGELADLSAEEAGELVAHVMAKLAVEDAHAREVAEKGLKAAVAVYELVKAVKSAPAPAPEAPAAA